MNFINTILSVFSTRIAEKFIRQINSIIISRFLGPSGLGIYTLFFALVKNLYTFSEFGMGAAGIYFIRRKSSEKNKIIENAALFSIITSIFLSFLVFIFREKISIFLLDKQSFFVLLISLVIPIIMISTIFSTLIRGMKEFRIFNIFTIIRPVCFFVFLFFAIILYNGDVVDAIIGQIVAITVSGFWLLYVVKTKTSFKLKFHKLLFLENLKYGIKQHFLKIVMMILSTSPLYILKGLTSNEIVGQYGIILTVLGIISFFKISISLVLTPKVSDLKNKDVHLLIAKVVRNSFFILTLVSLLAFILGPFYVELLYGEKFEYASKAFRWFLPGIVLHSVCVMLHRDFTAREIPVQYKAIFAYMIGAIISIFVSYFLVSHYSRYPLEALGISYNLSYFITFLILSTLFIFDSRLNIKSIFLLDKNDILFYIKSLKIIYNKIIYYVSK
ncbi:oligosaccharide flippase family protein [Candidatus Marinimicrobia bacterium]|nr:oligosaccharide flippase family protein [Candidatus Neomarinimicrobiota bacterium]